MLQLFLNSVLVTFGILSGVIAFCIVSIVISKAIKVIHKVVTVFKK
jgi:hypothetical protein